MKKKNVNKPNAVLSRHEAPLAEKALPSSPADPVQTKYPHHAVQSHIYSLLQTGLYVAVHFECLPAAHERQNLITLAIEAYEKSCDELKSQVVGQPGRTEAPIKKLSLALPPHYSAQTSVFSLLLSALNMAQHYEQYPGLEHRQKLIETALKSYQATCDPLKIDVGQ